MSHHSGSPFNNLSDEDRKKIEESFNENGFNGLADALKQSQQREDEIAKKQKAPANEQLLNDAMKPKFGATGNFPDGKVTDNDEGEIQFGMAIKDNVLIMNFGKPVEWIGFTKKEAIGLANYLLAKSEQLK